MKIYFPKQDFKIVELLIRTSNLFFTLDLTVRTKGVEGKKQRRLCKYICNDTKALVEGSVFLKLVLQGYRKKET